MRKVWLLVLMVGLLSAPAAARGAEILAISGVHSGAGDEPGQLDRPVDLGLAPDGSVVVADTRNHRVQRFARDGRLLWVRGATGPDGRPARGSGPGAFDEPRDVAIGPDGIAYVADSGNGRVQKLLVADGGFAGAFPAAASSGGPQGIGVDRDGTVYVTNPFSAGALRFTSTGTPLGSFGNFRRPLDVSALGGIIYVTDSAAHQILKFGAPGVLLTQWGRAPRDRLNPRPGELSEPNGVSATTNSRVVVVDTDVSRLYVFRSNGAFLHEFGDERKLSRPGGVSAFGDEVAIADTQNSRIVRLVFAQSPPAGAFCQTTTGTCSVGANGVPAVSMPNGDRSPVRFVTPRDACERLGRGAHLGREAFLAGRRFEVRRVAEGYMVEIPAEQIVTGSVYIAWRCRRTAERDAAARTAGFDFDIVNEQVGETTLIDPSGFVRDRRTRRGIPHATVTLQSMVSGQTRFGFADPLSVSPRVNPQKTDRRGHYGWDVPQGSYRISVRRFGYRPLRFSRTVFVPPPVTDLHVFLTPNPAEQARLIEPSGRVGRLRLGMTRAAALRAARPLRPRPRLVFRRGRLRRIELGSTRYRSAAEIGVRSTEAALRVAYGRTARRRGSRYVVGRVAFLVRGANGGTGRVRRVVVGS